jgi:flagellar biosynthetic protein FlhB
VPDSTQDRTEPATPRRRREAREQGQVAKSNDLAAAVVLLGGLIALYFTATPIVTRIVDVLRYCLGDSDLSMTRPDAMPRVGLSVMSTLAYVILPMLLGLMTVSIVVGVAQVGWNPTLKPLTPSLSKLNPIAGFRRFFSAQSLVQLAMSILKMIVVSMVVYHTLKDRYALVVSAVGLHHWAVMGLLGELLFSLGIRLAIVLLILAILDFIYRRYKFEQDLKMTKEEVKEEFRSMEGDPQVKQRRRKVQLDLTAQRMRTAVPKADVVVTNPTELAVALQYNEKTMTAPKVVAKGQGFMAEQIRKIAIEHGVPIVERRPLAQALYRQVEVGQEVPPAFYRAVAEILAYVYELTGKGHRRSPAPAGAQA